MVSSSSKFRRDLLWRVEKHIFSSTFKRFVNFFLNPSLVNHNWINEFGIWNSWYHLLEELKLVEVEIEYLHDDMGWGFQRFIPRNELLVN